MAFTITFMELVDVVIMTLATGFIFMDSFGQPKQDNYDPLAATKTSSFWNRLWYAAAIIAPAIVLHELGHKVVATSFGLVSTFHASYIFLVVGVVLKLLRFPVLIIVPAFVSTIGASATQLGWIAFAGPAVNAALWIVALVVLRSKNLSQQKIEFWTYTKFINGFLFIFNLVPIPGFDGSKVFGALLGLF